MQAPGSVNLSQLQAELVAEGIDVQTGLINNAGDIRRVAEDGTLSDLPHDAENVLAAHVPLPDPATLQRVQDAAILLNSSAVRDTQQHRDAFARLINCAPLTMPLDQDATPADIRPYIAA